MGLAHSPSIVMNGMVLYLDAGNPKGFDSNENLLLQTSQIGLTPTYSAGGIVGLNTTATTAPNDLYEASLLDNNGDSGINYVFGSGGIGLTTNTTYTYSIHIKQGTKPDFQITIDENGFGGKRYYSVFTYSTETVTTGVTGNTANDGVVVGSTATKLSNGWYRLSLTFRTSTTSVNGFVDMINRFGNSGSNYVWGRQLEYGSSASPYYATTGGIKTRGTTMIDITGTGNNGTLTNGPTYSSSNGGSLNYDGTNDYIQTPITGTFSQITFEFYGFFDDPNLNMLLRQESAFGDWTSNRVHFGTRWTGSNAGMHFNVNGVWQTTPPTYLRYGWNYYVLVYDTVNNLKRVYLNGILSSSHGTNGNMVLGDFRIGVATNLNQYYRGNISNFKIYNRALTEAEIQQNFNALRGRYGI